MKQRSNILPSWVMNWVFIVGIALSFVLFFNLAVGVFFPVTWGNECYENQPTEQITTAEQCEAEGGRWNQRFAPLGVEGLSPETVTQIQEDLEGQTLGSCDLAFECVQAAEAEREINARNAFIVLSVVSVAALLVGGLMILPEIVSTALSIASVLLLFTTAARFWGDAGDFMRMVVLGLFLVVIMYLGYRRTNSDK